MARIAAFMLASSLLVAAGVRTADAGKVIVMSIPGDPEGEVEDGLMSIVEDRHDLVTSGELERAARKAQISDLDGKALGRLARRLGADAVIEGSVSREDDGYLLVVRIRGNDGKTVKKISVDLVKRRLSSKAKKRLGTGILDGIDKTLGIDREDLEEVDDAPRRGRGAARGTKGKAKGKQATKPARQARTGARRPARAPAIEEEPEMDDDDDDDREEVRGGRDRVAVEDDDSDLEAALGVRRDRDDDGAGRQPPRAHPASRIAVGASGKQRTLRFTSRDFMQAPLGYDSSMVPGVHVAAEAYPLARKGAGPASGLGVGFELDQTLLMTTRSSDAPDVALPTTQKHWSVGIRFRYAFADRPTSPSVVASVGYGNRVFVVDRAALTGEDKLDMPDVAYRYYDPGLTLRVPVGARAAVHAGGKALLFKDAGPIQAPDSYGGAKLTGVEGTAGLEIRVAPSVVVDVTGSVTRIGYAFVGNGAESNNRDLDPETVDVGGAADQYLGVVGTIGYVY
jgi:hypothetical protein